MTPTENQSNGYEMAHDIDEHGQGLTSWEKDFVATVLAGRASDLTTAMLAKLTQIYEERVP